MLPLLPSSAYTRTRPFVTQEWNEYFAPTGARPATGVDGGWKGILYANLALINAKAAWNFFSQSNFDYSWIDGGASRTWYLAFAAGKFLPCVALNITDESSARWRSMNVEQAELRIGRVSLAMILYYLDRNSGRTKHYD